MKIFHETIGQYDGQDFYIERVEGEYSPEIGKFLIRFSELENTLDMCIVEFISGCHEPGYLVIEGLNLYNKLELFRKLYRRHLKYVAKQKKRTLKSLVRRLDDLRIFRNLLVHANWATLDRKRYVLTKIVERDGEVLFRKVRVTPQMIKARTRHATFLSEELFEFGADVRAAMN